MIKNTLFSLFLISACTLFAQTSNYVKFNELSHNFGEIKEEDGNVRFNFVFTNISNEPVFIKKVETSCGCTTPKFNTDTVLPGGQGQITAIYETAAKNGKFDKDLYIHFNFSANYQTLRIIGNVIPKPREVYKQEDEYNVNYGNLAFSESVLDFKNMLNSEKKEKVMKIYNYNAYPIKILELNEIPNFASVKLSDSTIKAGDSIKISIQIDGGRVSEMGSLFKRVGLLTNDRAARQKYIYLSYHMKEDFSKLSKKELKNAPHVQFSRQFPLQHGTRKAGEIYKDTITITNTGKSDLIIRKAVPSCSCINFNITQSVIKPGESMVLNLKFDLINQPSGEQKKYLKIFTNDPNKPETDIPFLMKIL